MALTETESNQDLLQAHDELWHQSVSYLKSLALALALNLRIPDAIHSHGGSATLAQILADAALHPCKLGALRRLMRALTVSGTFSVVADASASDDETSVVYKLTAASRFLVSGEVSSAATLAPFVSLVLYHIASSEQAVALAAWFRQEQNHPSALAALLSNPTFPTFWEHAEDANALLNKGMVAQSSFLMPIVLRECGEVFRGIDSLVDVGGGHGAAATAIAAAFPRLKCSVLDLPHVVAGAPSDTDVHFVAGDMFQSIPPATAVFLKTTLHDWGDDECVNILKNCMKAIAPRDAGGKVIILEAVVGHDKSNIKHLETQVFFDLFIIMVNGAERDEQEWKKIFIKAGFKDYKILPVACSTLSVIELYP